MDILKDELVQKFIGGEAGREDLASVAKRIKNSAVMASLVENEDFRSVFCDYFKNEDPKVRKNTAKLAALLEDERLSKTLYNAYREEETLYVRPQILKALVACGCDEFLEELKDRLVKLKKTSFSPEEEKHVAIEIRTLEELTGGGCHTFTGFMSPCELFLTTLPGTEDITVKLAADHAPKAVSGGVRVSVKKLQSILDIRTVEEFLFLIPGFTASDAEPAALAKAICKSNLLLFLDRRHKEQDMPYRFRIGLKLREDKDSASFIKKLSRELEFGSGHRLVNSTDDYEIELRITERKDGKASCLLKLYTLKDDRFSYRTKTISKGLRPSVAATAIAFAKEYLDGKAQVLDPFCGSGTLLIERAKALGAKNLYGVDIFGEAVTAARENTANAGFKANYINRDFFDFTHEYLFEEIITELPSETGNDKDDPKEILKLYRDFLEKSGSHLASGGVLLVLTRRKDIFEKALGRSDYVLQKKLEAGKNLGIYVLKT